MHFEFVLRDLEQKVFTDELLDLFLAEDQKTSDQRDSFLTDRAYRETRASLLEALSPAQAAQLEDMEGLHRAALRALSGVATASGLYTGLEKVLSGRWEPWLFARSAAHDALDDPQICPGYFQKRLQAEGIFRTLQAALSPPARSLLEDIEVLWGDRAWGVAAQGFRLGLQGAVRVLTTLRPKEISSQQLAPLLREAESLNDL